MKNSLFKKMFLGVAGILTLLVQAGGAELPAKCMEFDSSEIKADAFKRISSFAKYGLELLDDAEAVSGKAMALRKHPKGTPLHKHPTFEFGVYDAVSKKTLARLLIPKAEIPQNEKYNFFRIGRVTLTKNMFVYAHRSWAMQQNISSLYDAADPARNIVEVYVSIKFTGPEYVKNSKKENAVFIDQIVVLRTGVPCKAAASLPQELHGKVIRYIDANDFTTYRRFAKNGVKLVEDKDSLFGKAMFLGADSNKPNLHKVNFRMGVYSPARKKQIASKNIKLTDLAKDEKYHLIKIGSGTLENNCYFWGHNSWVMQQVLASLIDSNAEQNSGDFYVSVKFTGPSYVPGSTSPDGIFIDRILLAR